MKIRFARLLGIALAFAAAAAETNAEDDQQGFGRLGAASDVLTRFLRGKSIQVGDLVTYSAKKKLLFNPDYGLPEDTEAWRWMAGRYDREVLVKKEVINFDGDENAEISVTSDREDGARRVEVHLDIYGKMIRDHLIPNPQYVAFQVLSQEIESVTIDEDATCIVDTGEIPSIAITVRFNTKYKHDDAERGFEVRSVWTRYYALQVPYDGLLREVHLEEFIPSSGGGNPSDKHETTTTAIEWSIGGSPKA